MTIGVGGESQASVLAELRPLRDGVKPITNEEREQRIESAQSLMREQGIDAMYLDASSSLYYFTGVRFGSSERLHGAVIPAKGELAYIAPAFEEEKTRAQLVMGEDIRTWEEHEDPTALVVDTVRSMGRPSGTIAVDETTPFFIFDGLRRAGNSFDYVNADSVSGRCRMQKSDAEIALMQSAKFITLEAQKAAARILHEGITTTEVQTFLTQAHQRLGADGPPTFCIVLFGEPTAYPHGVAYPQTLEPGDMVLIDVGAPIEGYHSDITRSYVFGDANQRQRHVWDTEKQAQAAAFAAAEVGATCESVDAAARRVIEAAGFGPGYAVPGLPHRTGHGIGLDVHEWAYLVKGNKTQLAPGMCFSNEPMICIYGEFGVRLEDHFHVTNDGPVWFTEPSPSIDDPFGLEAIGS
jgi:Xaa-Pro dipeptidase